MPSTRSPPLAFGIEWALTAAGSYRPLRNAASIFVQSLRIRSRLCFISNPSTPAAPSFACTCTHAAFRFSLASTPSSVTGSVGPVSRIEFTPVVRPSRGLLPTLAMFPGIHPGSSFASSGEAAVIATPRQFRRTSRHSDRSSLVDRAFLFLQPFAPARFPGLLRYYGLC